MRISDWSSDVCSSDLDEGKRPHGALADDDRPARGTAGEIPQAHLAAAVAGSQQIAIGRESNRPHLALMACQHQGFGTAGQLPDLHHAGIVARRPAAAVGRSEEHTSELQSLMRTSYAVFCL